MGPPLELGRRIFVADPPADKPQGEGPPAEKPKREEPQGEQPQGKGEIMRNAQLLVTSKGAGAAKYAKDMLESVRKAGDERDIAFWEKIAAQVELLVYQLPED
ncbi:MAG: hypothetical protein HYY38_06540 [Rhodospirillales bacterium]|nr:hypothetical protein [Rhodospirillales bacterium]